MLLSTASEVFHSNKFLLFLSLYNVFTIAIVEFIKFVGKKVNSKAFLNKLPRIPEMFL